MKKISKITAIILSVMLVLSMTFVVQGASSLDPEDFILVFSASGATVGEATNTGVPVTFDDGSNGTRLTYMVPIKLDGLKIVLRNVSLPKTGGGNASLWMTYSQEPGHFWGEGATGFHMRYFQGDDSVSLYMNKADNPLDSGDSVWFPTGPISLKGFGIALTITVEKVGNKYEFGLNGSKVSIDASLVEANLSASGLCYWNFGVTDGQGVAEGKISSFTISEITNTKEAPAPTATQAPDPTKAPTQGGSSTGSTGETPGGNSVVGGDSSNDISDADPSEDLSEDLSEDASTVDPSEDEDLESSQAPDSDEEPVSSEDEAGKDTEKSSLLWLYIVLGVLVVAGAAVAVFFSTKKKK